MAAAPKSGRSLPVSGRAAACRAIDRTLDQRDAVHDRVEKGLERVPQPPILLAAGSRDAIETPAPLLGMLPAALDQAPRLELSQERVDRVRIQHDRATRERLDLLD